MATSLDQLVSNVIAIIGKEPFSTDDFITQFRAQYPRQWDELEEEYGKGGAGNGSKYTVNVRIGNLLGAKANRGEIKRLEYAREVPENWGSPVIRHWVIPNTIGSDTSLEIDSAKAREGYAIDASLLSRGRNRELAEARKSYDHYTCQACDFKLQIESRWVIEAHHLNPLSVTGETETKLEHLVSLCPTCHRISHLRSPPYTPKEIRQLRKASVNST